MKLILKKVKNNKGFTLLEVLIAMLILSIVATAATASFMYAFRTTRNNEIKMTAINLANRRIELIRSLTFANVGTKIEVSPAVYWQGDPAGDILQQETVTADGYHFIINTTINWEEQADWDLAGSASWDYKSVKVEVIPQNIENAADLKQIIETIVSRDASQPSLTGANIRLRFTRGWNTGSVVTVGGINVLLIGTSITRFVQSSYSKGIASFLALPAGVYNITLDPSSKGMILQPNQLVVLNQTLTDPSTASIPIEVEIPCAIHIIMRTLDGTLVSMDASGSGTVKVVPPIGTNIEKPFTGANVISGALPINFISGLWPVGMNASGTLGYAGAYSISALTIPDYHYFDTYTGTGASETVWDGTFEGPGTTKEVTCYFMNTVVPTGLTSGWVDSGNKILPGVDLFAVTGGASPSPTVGGLFNTSNANDTITMPANETSHFSATEIYLSNIGTATNPALEIKAGASLWLHAGKIVIGGQVKIESSGKIFLNTTWNDGSTYSSSVDGSQIGGVSGVPYGKIYFPDSVQDVSTLIISPGAYYYPEGTVLPDDIADLILITPLNYID